MKIHVHTVVTLVPPRPIDQNDDLIRIVSPQQIEDRVRNALTWLEGVVKTECTVTFEKGPDA